MSKSKSAKKTDEAALGHAHSLSPKLVVDHLAALKLQVGQVFDTIASDVVKELKTLEDVNLAIRLSKAKLEELHDYEEGVDTLESLNAEIKAAVEANDEVKRQIELTRARDEEKYQYDWDKRRQADTDLLRTALANMEKASAFALAEREGELNKRLELVGAREEELTTLRTQVNCFADRLDKEVKAAVAIACNSLKKDLTFEARVKELEFANQLALAKAEVSALQTQVSELEERNTELDAKYKEASDKVQAIAEKAIDGASRGQTVVYGNSEPAANETASRKR